MTVEYSVEICKGLEQKFRDNGLFRPMRIDHYDNGDRLTYEATAISGKENATVQLLVEKFVGGGFAGQVYRVRVLSIDNGSIDAIKVGEVYALKILIPPSKGSLFFRNLMYTVGFQASFQLQTNPTAARSGAIWQKFIRRAAKIRFGDESVVNDIHATFVDHDLGSCGELSDWVDGRTWRLEVDEYLDKLSPWKKGQPVDESKLGSPEYRSKYTFMHDFVALMHDIGAHEFARQYEWSTCKSQPNCLKKTSSEDDPTAGLMAVDFRAGLTLVPFLPMSPGDFKLILQGLKRGSLVQFDRGNIDELEQFMALHPEDFSDMKELLEELKITDDYYRKSIPDITHNHIRLLYSKKLWGTILKSTVDGWRVKNLIDDPWQQKFQNSTLLTLLFTLVGIVPFLGRWIRKIWARPDWRRHYQNLLTSPTYFLKALKGKMTESLIPWHRAGRMSAIDTMKINAFPPRYLLHLPLSILPIGLHKSLTSFTFLKERLDYYLARPIRLYFNADLREEWLREMVAEGEKKHIISPEDRDTILSQINEPFIQKYLKSLAVHVCTVPITQVVSIAVAIFYVMTHPELPSSQAWAIGLGIIALFQVIPISPGSLTRGLYVLYLVIKERNFKDYNIAVFLGFFKYIGYLAFPIQMAYRYPVLARFMAGHWATEAVHIVPVFGEGGALLERWVFCLFYNWPLTIGRRVRARLEKRKALKPRHWPVLICSLATIGGFYAIEDLMLQQTGQYPALKDIWWAMAGLPLVAGSLITIASGGVSFRGRIISTVVFSWMTAVLLTIFPKALHPELLVEPIISISDGVWRIFIFTIFSIVGVILTELMIPDPELRQLDSKPSGLSEALSAPSPKGSTYSVDE